MQERDSYSDVLRAAERAAFRLDDVILEAAQLDFARPFLPESLSRAGELGFLPPDEQRRLNHIRANTYLAMFGIVEEMILPFVLDQVRAALGGQEARTRALLQFASEEAKHIALFRRFASSFERGFGARCEIVGPAQAIADAVLAHAPLGVGLAILHIEWMTQRHYLESVREDGLLDPHFKSLLKHHFAEECQHAKLDTLLVLELSDQLSQRELERGLDDYFAIVEALDGLLAQQVELDLASFERACGRTLDAEQRVAFRASQLAACRFTYLGSGMSHPRFAAMVAHLSPHGAERLRAVGSRFV